jgi:hypothetical protein
MRKICILFFGNRNRDGDRVWASISGEVGGFCFSYVVEGCIREEAGETLLPVRHNPSPTFTRKQKGGEKGFEANIDSPILQAPFDSWYD